MTTVLETMIARMNTRAETSEAGRLSNIEELKERPISSSWGTLARITEFEEQARFYKGTAEGLEYIVEQSVDPVTKALEFFTKRIEQLTEGLIRQPAPQHSSNQFACAVEAIAHSYKGKQIQNLQSLLSELEASAPK